MKKASASLTLYVRSKYEPEVSFIDRDGTLISEPPSDFQVDRFDKLAFEPEVVPALLKLQNAGYKLVMITNGMDWERKASRRLSLTGRIT